MFRLLLLPELGHNAAYPKTTKCGVRTQQMFAKGIFNTKKSYHFTKNTIIYSRIHRSSCKIYDPFPEYLKESVLLFPLWCSSLFLHRLNEDICLTIFSLSNYTTNSPIFLVICKKKKETQNMSEIHTLYLALSLIIRRMMDAEWFYKSLNFDAPSWKMNLYYHWNPRAACIKQREKLLTRKVDGKICGFFTYSNA